MLIFAWKLVSRTSKQVLEKLGGAMMATGGGGGLE